MAVFEAPDSATAAAVALFIGGSGAFRSVATHELVSAAELVDVLRKAAAARPGNARSWRRTKLIFPSLSLSLIRHRPHRSAAGRSRSGAARRTDDGCPRTPVGRPRKRERSAQRRSRSTSPAPSAGHRPRRAGRVKGGAVRGPRTPHSTVATRCPSGTRDPTTTTSRAASTRKPGRSRVRAMSVRYDPAFHGQPRSLPATLASRSAPVPRQPVGFPS